MSDTIANRRTPLGFFQIISPLPPSECVARLAAMTRYETSPLKGSVAENFFRLRYHGSGVAYTRNGVRPHVGSGYQPYILGTAFAPYIFGKMRQLDGETVINCHLTLHPLVMWLLAFLYCAAIVGAVVTHTWIFIAALVLISLVGVTACSGERELLVSELLTTVSARIM